MDEERAFPNRSSRKRAVDKVKSSLPATPKKKVEVIKKVLERSTLRETDK